MSFYCCYLVPLLLFSLVGCATSSISSSSITSTASMPGTLQVSRDTGAINHYPPLIRTVTKKNVVQILYKAALALPKVSTTGQAHSCPAAFDLIYHLRFYQNGVLIERMDMNPSGCPYITINKTDMRPLSQAFIALFAQTIGVPLAQVDIQPIPQKAKPSLHY